MSRMPRALPLVLCITLSAFAAQPARAQAGTVRPAAPASTGESPRLVRKDEQEADTWKLKADDLRSRGDQPAALHAYEEALKRYVDIYLREKPLPSPPPVPPRDATAEEYGRFRHGLVSLLKRMTETIEGYFAVGGMGTDRFGREQLEVLRAHAELMSEDDANRTTFFGPEVDQRAKLLSKPEPGFTEEARRNRVSGPVRLRLVLSADGTVKHIFVLKGLPHGITELAVDAARQIRFEPAVKDGRRVSMFVTVEYNFNTY